MLNNLLEKLDSFGVGGIDFYLTKNNVETISFIPTQLEREFSDIYVLSSPYSGFASFQVCLVEPFFLPLRKSLNGSFKNYIYELSEVLKEDEEISVAWTFMEVDGWRDKAIDMYSSYLEGNNNPSSIPLVLNMQNKFYAYTNHLSSNISSRRYSKEVEDKILSKGYAFQCVIHVKSERTSVLVEVIQEILSDYDYYNYLRVEEVESMHPYNLELTKQLLSKSEILSLFVHEKVAVIENEEDVVEEVGNKEKPNLSALNYRIKLLPDIPIENVEIDDEITIKLAEALKRVRIIKQARLYNESVQQGSRLIVATADMPKGKNFSDIEKRRKDIQVAMGVESLSIEQGDKPNTIKFSISHHRQQIVSLRSLLEDERFHEYASKHTLAFPVGVDEINEPIYLSLEQLRHILIVGSQGSGKSVFANQLITALIMTHTSEQLNFLMIDPKRVELSQYKNFPHVRNVITNMDEAIGEFYKLIDEMEERYELMEKAKVKTLKAYNEKSDEKKPYLVCVIEEWGDLHSVKGEVAEEVVLRLGQKARAAGIFLIIVTQRPSAKILSGDIKANIQSKFSFNLGTNINYKTVFDTGISFGRLLGRGDGVFKVEGYPKEFQRFQSPIVALSDEDAEEFYNELLKTYDGKAMSNIVEDEVVEDTFIEAEDEVSDDLLMLVSLKRIIAKTGETRVTVLREKMGVKSEKMSELMSTLVEEGWLKRHKSRAKGYELILSDDLLDRWRG